MALFGKVATQTKILPPNTPICVDLDDSLIKTDVMLESLFNLLLHRQVFLFLLPFWFLKGRAYFKKKLAENIRVNVEALPYNQAVVNYLKDQRALGFRIVLATAAHISVAEAVAQYLGIFERVFGTDSVNLSGRNKAKALTAAYGEKGFIYVGDRSVDLAVWQHASGAIMVNPTAYLVRKARKVTKVYKIFSEHHRLVPTLIEALRPHQWVKNLLIFAPVFLAHHLKSPRDVLISVYAFATFCLCASSVYVLNDLVDIDSDRRHPVKSRRPFASGRISPLWGIILFPGLLFGSLVLGTSVGAAFFSVVLSYFVITLAYSLRLKQTLIADVIILASLYTIRIYAGSIATGISISPWLLAFSIFFFLALAIVKRTSELVMLRNANKTATSGRGYLVQDIGPLAGLSSASGYLAVLVFALYLNSPAIVSLYRRPLLLWFVCPLMLYWISRVLVLAERGDIHSDPIVFALKDRTSYLIGLMILIVFFIALPRPI